MFIFLALFLLNEALSFTEKCGALLVALGFTEDGELCSWTLPPSSLAESALPLDPGVEAHQMSSGTNVPLVLVPRISSPHFLAPLV